MPQAVIAIGTAVISTVGAVVSTQLGLALATIGAGAIGVATVVAAGMLANKLISNLYEMPQMDTDQSRQNTVKSTIEPMKIVYGETLVSGPLSFVSTTGEKNKDLWHVVVLTGHESNAITDIYLDNEPILNSDIAANGNVTGGTFGPKNTKTVCVVKKHLGGSGQVVDPDLDAAFTLINSNHIGTGLTYIVTKFTLIKESQELWEQYNPQNIKGLVQGRKVYNNLTDTTEWSDNPVWCLMDYLTNTDFGMGIDQSKIDWDAADVAAAACDVLVDIPNSQTEKRFTCNGVLFGTDSHKTNVNKILSSMNGMLAYTNGKYVIHVGIPSGANVNTDLISDAMIRAAVKFEPEAGQFDTEYNGRKVGDINNDGQVSAADAAIYLRYNSDELDPSDPTDASHIAYIEGQMEEAMLYYFYTFSDYINYQAPDVILNEDNLSGAIQLKTSVERSERFNTVTGTFIDPDQNYKSVEFNTIQVPLALARDNGETLTKEVQLPMTNSQYMAQRIGYKLINQSFLQKTMIFPANLSAMRVAVGETIGVSIDEFGWNAKQFLCLGWTFSDSGNGGINLTLREDSSGSYQDPDPAKGEYTTPATLGALPNSFQEAEGPTNLTATGGLQNIVLEWDNPDMSDVLYIEIYASSSSAWSGASKIGTTTSTQFTHGGSNKVDPISEGDTRYYWVRARNFEFSDDATALSPRFPNSDASGIVASAGVIPAGSATLSVSANNVNGFDSGPNFSGTVTSGTASVTVSGGTSPYTYSWSHVSTSNGTTPSISSSTISNPYWSGTVSDGNSSVSTWQVTVTDNASATASAYVTVTLTWFDNSGGAIP
jgi:hypothetical protein